MAFVFPYRRASADEFDPSLPTDAAFFPLLVHEAFHRYQMEEGGWAEDPEWTQDEAAYPITKDNLALVLLEHRLLVEGMKASDVAAKEIALQRFAAVRAARAALPEVVVAGVNFVDHLDAPQEVLEGTANYAELRFLEQAKLMTPTQSRDQVIERLEALFVDEYAASSDMVRFELAAGRFYATGSALGTLLDEVGNVDWRSACKSGKSPIHSVRTRFPSLAGAELDKKVADAKSAHAFAAIVARAEALLALPAESLRADTRAGAGASPTERSARCIEARLRRPAHGRPARWP